MTIRTRWARPLSLVLPLAAALVVGCAEDRVDKWQRELAAAEGRWRSAGVQDYEMDLLRTCACAPAQTEPVTVTVRGGAFTSIAYINTPTVAVDTALFRQYLTMDRIFALMQEVLDTRPAYLYAEYNEAYGFPRVWNVDPDSRTAYEEFQVEVYAFRRLTAATR